MYLALNDLAALFKERQGALEDHRVYTVTDHSKCLQPKGVFVYINGESGDLQEAIANGAIAAIWDKAAEIPRYTPTHFPLFLTTDPVQAVGKVLQFYEKKLNGEAEEEMEATKFNFLNKKLLNENKHTYDIAVLLKNISKKINPENLKGRE